MWMALDEGQREPGFRKLTTEKAAGHSSPHVCTDYPIPFSDKVPSGGHSLSTPLIRSTYLEKRDIYQRETDCSRGLHIAGASLHADD